MLSASLEAADILCGQGVSARVLNMATIKPIDVEAVVKAAEETGALVTAEEHSIIGGLGSAVSEVVGEMCPVPVERIGVRDVFGQSGTPDELMKVYSLTADDIVRAAVRAIERNGT